MFQQYLSLFMLFLAATSGWYVFSRLKIPTPQFMGPLIVVATLNSLDVSLPVLNPLINSIAQIFMGYYLGSNISPEYIRQMKKFLPPILITASWSLLITFLFGYIIFTIMPLDLGTGILSASPGGLPEVGVIALAIEANIPVITMMHLVRMFGVMAFIPLAIKALKFGNPTPLVEDRRSDANRFTDTLRFKERVRDITKIVLYQKIGSNVLWLFQRTPAIAVLAGILLSRLNIPAGFMLGGMFGVVAATLGGVKVEPLPGELFNLALLMVSIFIGMQFTRESLVQLSELYVFVLLINFVILLASIGLAFMIQRVTGWSFLTCLLASAPGALFMMVAVASEMDSDPFKVSLLHIARLFTVKATLPIIAMFLR